MRWAVLTANQASGQIDGLDVCVYHDREDAVDEARRRADETASVGRRERHYVARLEDSADWDQIEASREARQAHYEALAEQSRQVDA